MGHQPRPSIDLRRWTSLALIAAFAGCGEETTITTLRPKLALEPPAGTTLEFGEVVLTQTSVGPQSVRLSNAGDAMLTVDQVVIEGPDAAAFYISDAPERIAPGASREVWVRYEPQLPGPKQAVLRIRSNDGSQPDVSYPLSAGAREPCVMFVDKTRMLFRVGDVQELTISSLSTHECVVDRVFVDESIFEPSELPEVPFSIPGGQSVTFKLEHHPASTRFPGVPVRELSIRETEGSELKVLLEGEAPLFGCLSAFPLDISFPQTEVGQTRRQRVTVTNQCGRPAAITSVVISRGWTAFEVEGMYPREIEPGGRAEVFVRYVPQTALDLGRITINSNDASNPRFRVHVRGTAALPNIEAFPPRLDFGTVIHRDTSGQAMRSECASAARFVQIYSTGSAPLTIERLEVAGADGHFEITGVTVDGQGVSNFSQPFQVPVNKAAAIGLQFYPSRLTPEAHHSELVIHHNGGDREPRRIRLEGTAAGDGPVRDIFTQLEGPKVDILWVIDNSCSMFDEQARLIQNLSQFVSYADSQNADYQMAVTTTDSLSPDAGKLEFCYPHPRIIRHDYERREEAFRCLFEVGVTGPYIEAGAGAAMRAIQRAQRVDDDPVRNRNIGFLRDDATLAIVMMSDEDDQSLESDDLLISFFNSVHGPGRTTVHAIAGPVAEPCLSRQAMPGYRYHAFTQAMDGLFQNICAEDWQPLLRNLGLNVFVPLEEWELSQAADPSTLTVSIDGRPVIWSQGNGYTYDASQNSVTFHGNAVPAPGQQIEVDYLGNCRP